MDRLGHALLRKRLRLCPEVLESMLDGPVVTGFLQAGGAAHHFVLTGAGSSEAHARYLACLLNRYTPHRAEYRHLSSFFLRPDSDDSGRDLVVFSQGLSPNARLALGRASHFRQAFLFTAATVEGAREEGEHEKADYLVKLKERRVAILHYPLENETRTLLRLVGPLAGYLAAVQFAESLSGGNLPPLDRETLLHVARSARERLPAEMLALTRRHLKGGFHLVVPEPLSGFAHNLAYKFLEGLYLPAPPIWDLLHFAHGPFQENCRTRCPVILLLGQNGDPGERELFSRARMAIESAEAGPIWVLYSALPPLYRIFEYEMAFNHLLTGMLDKTRINQIDWPGKGLDRPLYQLGEGGGDD